MNDLLKTHYPLWPEINIQIEPVVMNYLGSKNKVISNEQVTLRTAIRICENDVWYRIDCKEENTQPPGFTFTETMQNLIRNVYIWQVAYKIDPDLKNEKGNPVFVKDIDQRSELDRLSDNLMKI